MEEDQEEDQEEQKEETEDMDGHILVSSLSLLQPMLSYLLSLSLHPSELLSMLSKTLYFIEVTESVTDPIPTPCIYDVLYLAPPEL